MRKSKEPPRPKRYSVPGARLSNWNHPAPERTAYRAAAGHMNFDYICQVFSNRPAMLTACRMSDTGVVGNNPLRPLVKGPATPAGPTCETCLVTLGQGPCPNCHAVVAWKELAASNPELEITRAN